MWGTCHWRTLTRTCLCMRPSPWTPYRSIYCTALNDFVICKLVFNEDSSYMVHFGKFRQFANYAKRERKRVLHLSSHIGLMQVLPRHPWQILEADRFAINTKSRKSEEVLMGISTSGGFKTFANTSSSISKARDVYMCMYVCTHSHLRTCTTLLFYQ